MLPRFLFAPGAGAPSSSAWMQRFARGLGAIGPTRTFDYGYQLAGKKRPDPLPALIAAHTAALEESKARWLTAPALIGKSMGSRVGCHVALTQHVPCLICLGYPLRSAASAKGKTKLRDEVLLALRTPILFVQGTRDALCPLDLLEEVRSTMLAPSELLVVDTGDHSLLVTAEYRRRAGKTQDQVDAEILGRIAEFVREVPELEPVKSP